MHVVNELNYPALRYYNYPSLLAHLDFEHIYKKLTDSETVDYLVKHPDEPIGKISKTLPDAFAPIIDIKHDGFQSFPFFALRKNDALTCDMDRVYMLWDLFLKMWPFYFCDKEFEIVKGSMWDDMFYFAPDGYDDWLRNKMEKGFESSGIIIRPHEQICEFYFILYTEKGMTEISFAFHRKELIYAHASFEGFISSALDLAPMLENIAEHRHITRQEAFFQEDMYNILRWLYYKESFRMKPVPVPRVKKFIDGNGYTDFRMATDTPCVMFEKPVAN